MNIPLTNSESVNRDGAILVRLSIFLIVLAHWATGYADGLAVWGIGFWGGLPVVARHVLLGVAVLVLVFGDRVVPRWSTSPAIVLTFCLAAFVGLAIAFPTHARVYGDGYAIASVAGAPEFPVLTGNLLLQPLDLYIHWAAHHYLIGPLGGSAEMAYLAVGIVCGVVALFGLWRIGGRLGNGVSARLFLIFSLLGGGISVFWFGHVESYTLCLTTSIWLIEAFLTGNLRRAWILGAFAIGFHAVAVAWLPALIIASHRLKIVRPWMAGVGLFFLGALASLLLPFLGIHALVPVWPTTDSPYSAFAPVHLVDLLNLVVFTAPLAIVALLFRIGNSRLGRPVPTAIANMAVGGLVFAFWVDPTLGAFRDWDLLGIFAPPLLAWGAWIIWTRLNQRAYGASVAAALVLMFAHSGVWVAINQNEMVAAARVERLTWTDPHYSCSYDRGARHAPWAQILTGQLGMHSEATAHFVRRVECAPEDHVSWANLGIVYQTRQLLDSAMIAYDAARSHDSTNALYHLAFGQVAYSLGLYTQALAPLEAAARLAPELYQCQLAVGAVYLMLDRLDDADSHVVAARRISPVNPEVDTLEAYVARRRTVIGGTKKG